MAHKVASVRDADRIVVLRGGRVAEQGRPDELLALGGVYAALCAGTAFLFVGHRSVYASQKLSISKSAGLEVPQDIAVGDLTRAGLRIRPGSLTDRFHTAVRPSRRVRRDPEGPEKPG